MLCLFKKSQSKSLLGMWRLNVRNNVHSLALCLLGNDFTKFLCSPFNRPGGRHAGSDNLDILRCQRLGDPTPVVYAGYELIWNQAQFVKSEETVSKYDGVLRCLVLRANGGELVLEHSSELLETRILGALVAC